MFVRVVPLSQSSSRDLLYVKCFVCYVDLSPVVEKLLYVNMFDVYFSRYLSPVVEMLLYVKCLCDCLVIISPVVDVLLNVVQCLCVLSRYLSPVVEICHTVKCLPG